MSADVINGLITFLKADSPMAALVGTRVFGIELPASEAGSMPRKAVVLKPTPGSTLTDGSYLEHTGQRIDAFSYGETPFESERVRRAVFDAFKALQRKVSAAVLIHWCEPAGGFANLRDPDAGWPVNFQSFQAFYAETAV